MRQGWDQRFAMNVFGAGTVADSAPDHWRGSGCTLRAPLPEQATSARLMAALHPILVIGAGVIGLSTAVTLAEAGYPVVVRTAEPSEATTSAVAGAFWGRG